MNSNPLLAEVEEDFIQDDFNLTGLSAQVPHYEFALDTILDVESPATAGFSEEQQVSPCRTQQAAARISALAVGSCHTHPHAHPRPPPAPAPARAR